MVAVLSCRLRCRQRLGNRLDVVLNLFGMALQATAFYRGWGASLSSSVAAFLGVRIRSIPCRKFLEFARGTLEQEHVHALPMKQTLEQQINGLEIFECLFFGFKDTDTLCQSNRIENISDLRGWMRNP